MPSPTDYIVGEAFRLPRAGEPRPYIGLCVENGARQPPENALRKKFYILLKKYNLPIDISYTIMVYFNQDKKEK